CCSLSCARLSTSCCLSAPNAFNLFVKTRYGELKQSDPSLKSNEIFRKLGEEYRKLTSKQKEELKSHGSTIASQMDVSLADKRKRLMYAHKHGMPRKPPISGLNVYIREKLCDLKDRLTHGQLLFPWNPSPPRPSRFSLEYLLLPPRSAPVAAPLKLTPEASRSPRRPSYSLPPLRA
ncbi:hypothetical protein AHF37_07498, partial [Paragonimus kellicotti]